MRKANLVRYIAKLPNVVNNSMIDENKYKFNWGDNLVNINTLSPNKKYFYQIQKPFDFYWGWFVAKISFLDIKKEIIYYNNQYYACPINSSEENDFKYVSFSECGNYAYFCEFKDFKNVYHILINFKERKFKRIKKKSEKEIITTNLTKDGFNTEDLKIFEYTKWELTQINKRFERNIFFCKIWFPKI
ncbi:hypothetical protein M9Q43_13980 [Flavobacterium sp. HXWNR29]|uniref:hypothetical protein n=1 Tax=Flavobacterium odoriferum TaxID=2946604 RepID=UPI0021CB4C0E|nr:hypothetical protein [Flavobacterium sp. HXWNR29]MCU4190269.1 hypothetical protein [Flavobacterium sp. HXWNR29]